MIPYTRQLKMSDNYRTNFRDNGHTNKTCSLVSCRLPNAGANFEKIRGSVVGKLCYGMWSKKLEGHFQTDISDYFDHTRILHKICCYILLPPR